MKCLKSSDCRMAGSCYNVVNGVTNNCEDKQFFSFTISVNVKIVSKCISLPPDFSYSFF